MYSSGIAIIRFAVSGLAAAKLANPDEIRSVKMNVAANFFVVCIS